MRKFKKRYLLIIAFILLIFIVYPPLTYKKLSNSNPLQNNFVKGVFHVHSDFSDGKGDIDEITRAAESHNLDFVILTDHGEPNLKCAESTSYKNNTLLIGGSEFSLDCGHLAAAGFKVEKYQFPREPQEAVNDVNSCRGFSFISHPFDKKIPWTDWDVKDFTGIEVLSSYSSARRIGIFKLIAFPFRYILNHEYSLLSSLDYPERNLSVWDSFNKNGKYMGIYALDAHAKIPLTKKISMNFPSYKSIFGVLNVYVKIDRPLSSEPSGSADLIISSIRKGHFFNVIEGISSANGFEMVFTSEEGTNFVMGEIFPDTEGVFIVKLPFDFPTRVNIIKDGISFYNEVLKPSSTAKIKTDGPGVYRAEIFVVKGKFPKLPWIITNPFFIGTGEAAKPQKDIINFSKQILESNDIFALEKNELSSGRTFCEVSEEAGNKIVLEYDLRREKGKKDFWVSMAARTALDLSGFTGISFESRSSELMRYWLEMRTGSEKTESWYRHSFLSYGEWKTFMIPFEKFRLISGNKNNKVIDISNLNSLFFSVNGSIVNYPVTKGTLEIRNIAVYK